MSTSTSLKVETFAGTNLRGYKLSRKLRTEIIFRGYILSGSTLFDDFTVELSRPPNFIKCGCINLLHHVRYFLVIAYYAPWECFKIVGKIYIFLINTRNTRNTRGFLWNDGYRISRMDFLKRFCGYKLLRSTKNLRNLRKFCTQQFIPLIV